MPDQNFLNVHILHPAPYSNLNRDDTGTPKTMTYGGVTRARWSSQALKRAARVRFESCSPSDRTVRSTRNPAEVAQRAAAALTARGVDVDEKRHADLLKGAASKIRNLVSKDAKDGDPEKGETLTWLAEAELNSMVDDLVATHVDGGAAQGVSAETASLSIAGFGRMFANAPTQQTEAAVQVAHAFTVHAASLEVDYFTAVDDLKELAKDSGSGHLGVAQYTSGLFYRHLTIDRGQLLRNWTSAGDEDAAARLEDFLRACFTTLPTGKQSSTAPHTLPTLVAVTPSHAPTSLADAFHAPVPFGGDQQGAAREALLGYWDQLDEMYPSQRSSRLVAHLGSGVSADEIVARSAAWLLAGGEGL